MIALCRRSKRAVQREMFCASTFETCFALLLTIHTLVAYTTAIEALGLLFLFGTVFGNVSTFSAVETTRIEMSTGAVFCLVSGIATCVASFRRRRRGKRHLRVERIVSPIGWWK